MDSNPALTQQLQPPLIFCPTVVMLAKPQWRPQVVRSGKGADDSSSDDDDEPRSASAAGGSSSSSSSSAAAGAAAASSANEDDNMDDAPAAPAVDPDGWETVTSGRKKKGGKK